MTSHPFDSGGATGTPDRPCAKCGLSAHDSIHQQAAAPAACWSGATMRPSDCVFLSYEEFLDLPVRSISSRVPHDPVGTQWKTEIFGRWMVFEVAEPLTVSCRWIAFAHYAGSGRLPLRSPVLEKQKTGRG